MDKLIGGGGLHHGEDFRQSAVHVGCVVGDSDHAEDQGLMGILASVSATDTLKVLRSFCFRLLALFRFSFKEKTPCSLNSRRRVPMIMAVYRLRFRRDKKSKAWIPACAGMTRK